MRNITAAAFANGQSTVEEQTKMSLLSEELEGIRIVTKALETYWSKLSEEGEGLRDEQAPAPPWEERTPPPIDVMPLLLSSTQAYFWAFYLSF